MLGSEDICRVVQEFSIAADCSVLLLIVSNLPSFFFKMNLNITVRYSSLISGSKFQLFHPCV